MNSNPVKELIETYGWTPEQLAYKLGASFSSVKNWRFGRTKPIAIFREKLDRLYREQKEKQKPGYE